MIAFDPYHAWLGIPPEEQPPNHYRLLGINPHEANLDVIANAAHRQMLFIKQFQTGNRQAESQRLLNEVAAAKVCLLNAATKAEYDAALNQSSAPEQPPDELQPKARRVPPLSSGFFDADSEFRHPFSASPLKRKSHQNEWKVRVVGHILAPIIGLFIGWLILQWIRSDPPDKQVAQEKPLLASKEDEGSVPLGSQQPDAASVNPFELQADSAITSQKVAPARNPPPISPGVNAESASERIRDGGDEPVSEPAAMPSVSLTDQIAAARQRQSDAIADGNIDAALEATNMLVGLEKGDLIRVKLEVLETLAGQSATLNQSVLARRCLTLLDEAIQANRRDDAERVATLALAAARQANDTALIRRATLGLLKVRSAGDREEVEPDAPHGLQPKPDSGVGEVSTVEIARPQRPSKVAQLRKKFAPDAVKIDGHYYKVFLQDRISWESARTACGAMGGYLVCLETENEQKAVAKLKGNLVVWVGAYKDEKGFRWVNGGEVPIEQITWRDERYVCYCKQGSLQAYQLITRSNNGLANPPATSVQGFICEWEE